MPLRDYQQTAKKNVQDRFAKGANGVLLTLPTGAGKTRVFTDITKDDVEAQQKVVILVHRETLLDQAVKNLKEEGLFHGVIQACDSTAPLAPVQVASVDSLQTRQLPWEPDRFVVDEAHLGKANRYMSLFRRYWLAKRLLVTATAHRLDRSSFADVADCMVAGPTIQELIDHPKGPYLVNPIMVTGSVVNIPRTMLSSYGDYNIKDLERHMVKFVADIVKTYIDKAMGRRGIVFAVSVAHSKLIRDAFMAAGIEARHIDGTMPKEQRKTIIEMHQAGYFPILTNCMLLSEGYDDPQVSYVGLARPTESLPLYIQQGGRCLRIYPGKTDCIIADHADHIPKFGHILDEREWFLNGTVELKTYDFIRCGSCWCWLHKLSPECYYCQMPNRRMPALTEPKATPLIHIEYKKLLRYGEANGHRRSWAFTALIRKYGQSKVLKGLTPLDSHRLLKEVFG